MAATATSVPESCAAAKRASHVLAGAPTEQKNEALRRTAELPEAGLPQDSVVLLDSGERDDLAELATQDDFVDLLIPRGGEGLKAALKNVATVPVMYAAAGNCHVYVHDDADLEMAQAIAYNAKV